MGWFNKTFDKKVNDRVKWLRAGRSPFQVYSAEKEDDEALKLVHTALEQHLRESTKEFTIPVLIRQHKSNEEGQAVLQTEAAILVENGYDMNVASAGSHVHAGRLILTGGLSIFAGKQGIRSDGSMTVTYQKKPAQA